MAGPAMPYSRLYSLLARHWWLAFLVLGLSFVGFGLSSLNLLHVLSANVEFLTTYGWDAVRDGALWQLVQLVVSGYVAAACYVACKLCEKVLVERLAVDQRKRN
jgi:hypothetical protein